MGTTLTGTTPQTTYDSLIKVTDNGPLGGSLKTLTDGLGNDSALALSTGAASVTGTLAVSSNLTVDTDTLFVDAANNRVGIGTTSNYSFNDDAKLAVANTAGNSTISIVSSTSGIGYLAFADGTSGTDRYTGSINYNHSTNAMTLHTNAGNERMIITSTGNVGIGTSSPAAKLHVDGAFGTSSGAYISGSTYGMLGVNRGASNASAGVQYYNIGSQKWFAGIYENTDNFGFYSVGTSSFPMVIEYSTGNVGIGTATPNTKLTVFQSGASGIATMDISGGGTGAGALQISAGRVLGTTSFDLIQNNAGAFINQRDNNPLGILVNGSERLSITAAGNVGIGTSSPSVKLDVTGQVKAAGVDYHTFSVASGSAQIRLERTGTSTGVSYIGADNDGLKVFNSSFSELARIDSSGNLSLISGSIALSGAGAGIFLGGSIGSANGLDDYEEGTWTMGISFGNASTGIAYTRNTGTYTKIGRQVTVQGYLTLSSKGSASGGARITGLPFTISNNDAAYSAASMWLNNISFANQYNAISEIGTTNIEFYEVTEAGAFSVLTDADFANTSEVVFSMSYIA